MTDGQSFSLIPERTLAEQYFENLHTAYRSMREVFKLRAAQGMTQDDLADRLNSDKGLISRRLNGRGTSNSQNTERYGIWLGLWSQYSIYTLRRVSKP